MTEHEKKLFVKDFSQAIIEENAAIFAGAGLSIPAGFVNWKDLLREIANDLGLIIDEEHDLIAIAQYHFNKHKRAKLNTLIAHEFIQKTRMTDNHKILARLPIKNYWTTNYDKLIENALDEANKIPDVIIHKEDFSRPLPKRDAVVYKMHGDISNAAEAVITQDDYEKYNEKRRIFTTALQGDLSTRTFLFIGFSFDDPNLKYILSRIRILLEDNQVKHYCFFRKVKRDQFPDTKEGQRKFNREEIHQELKVKDLTRYNINAYLVDEYGEITELLRQIESRIKRTAVFISGAAQEYGRWEPEQANTFIFRLSNKLAERYKIVTGFGLGVGSSVINGVLNYVFSTKYRHLDNFLVLRPFPQILPPGSDKQSQWNNYRQEMISNAGIAIFLFGNKLTATGQVIDSDGLQNEFDIAIEQGVKVIPIGATGYMAKILWNKVMNSYDQYYPNNTDLQDALKELGNDLATEDDIISNTLKAAGILHNM